MKQADRRVWNELGGEIRDLVKSQPEGPPRASGVTDLDPKGIPIHLLVKGNYKNPDEVVPPGFPSIFAGLLPSYEDHPTGATSGRRQALAEWMTRPDHPLTARVMVNRLWQNHFGHGIVATPSDFGTQGTEPSHPELLDWLSTEFVARGWGMKALHRLMVTSATYRQSSTAAPKSLDDSQGSRSKVSHGKPPSGCCVLHM